MKKIVRNFTIAFCLAFCGVSQADKDLFDSMLDYSHFANSDAGVVLPEEISREIFDEIIFIDTRSKKAFLESHIPGAIHIEWREVLDRIDEIPDNRKIVMYCDTGVFSAQATYELRVIGMDNVFVMQTGYEGWLLDAAYKPESADGIGKKD